MCGVRIRAGAAVTLRAWMSPLYRPLAWGSTRGPRSPAERAAGQGAPPRDLV